MSVDFAVRDYFYPFSILRLRSFFERSQWLPVEDLVGYQERMLRRAIQHAYSQVPYYQDLFRAHKLTPEDIRTVPDLQKIPPLPKNVLRSEFTRLQAQNMSRYHPRVHQTSGTNAAPVRFLLDKPAHVLEFVHYWRHWSWAGYRLGAPFAELSSQYFVKSDRLSNQPYCYQRGLGRLLLNSLTLSPERVRDHYDALKTYHPRFLKGTASALYFFALFCRQRGIADVAFQAIFSTGEVLLATQRTLIENVFHGKVYDSYGHMERTVAISECPSGGFHVNAEYGILELVEREPLPTTEHSAAGLQPTRYRAKILGTSLHTRSMPLLRYQVGDVVEVDEPSDPCACGRHLPRICRVNGRQEDVIVTPDGRAITTLFIVFGLVQGISLGQIVQVAPSRVLVRIVRSEEYTQDSEAALVGYLRRFLGVAMQIEIEYLSADALRRQTEGKFRAIVSKLSVTAQG